MGTSVRKLKLVICNDLEKEKINEMYQFIRDAQYQQYRALNYAYGILLAGYQAGNMDLKSEEYKKAYDSLNAQNPLMQLPFGTGLSSRGLTRQKVTKDFKSDIKNGLAKGERSGRNYKRTFPLMTRGRDLKFKYENEDVIISWVGKTRFGEPIKFKVIHGRKDKDTVELAHFLDCVISGQYKVQQSSLYFNDKKLMLNLTVDMEFKKHELDENNILGVDLGIAVPVMCGMNHGKATMSIGDINSFLKVRTQMQERKRRLQKDLKFKRGGRGRKHKLKPLEKLRDKERNWVHTYNHGLSKAVVDFAIKNNCKYIHMEKLTKDGFNDRLLRNWSYYELQQMIEYKAERVGIVVRYVNPAYTSQTCSKCGAIHKESRINQSTYICVECGHEINADYNASINIARSMNFVK